MAEVQKYSLIEELKKADETLKGSPSLLGMTMLTYPNYINSMRSTMFTAHLRQFLNLTHPDIPLLFTNNENMVGKYSTGHREAEADLTVWKKIVKFEDIVDEPKIYELFILNNETHKFDVIHREPCQDLTENFGFEYINDTIDNVVDGDVIPKDSVLFRSTSYDEDLNYAYGKNVTVAYTLDPFTSEDAAIISRSLCKEFESIETETIKICLNNNDYMLNLYGNKKEYKPLPEIGDTISDILLVVRRQFNNQLLFDFKEDSLRKILDGDIQYFVDSDVEIIDYTIYNNNEFPIENPFYDQVNKYSKSQHKYYKEILKTCLEIKELCDNPDNDYTCSKEINYLCKRAAEILDTEKKWKQTDSVFSNMEISVKIMRKVPLAKGCKITG